MGVSDPVDLPEHGESGLLSVRIFEDLRYYWWGHSEKASLQYVLVFSCKLFVKHFAHT